MNRMITSRTTVIFPTLCWIRSFFFGAFAYPLLEIAYRGHTHWTMALAGGLALSFLYGFQMAFSQISLWRRSLLGLLTIMVIELAIGTIANLTLGWNVWDYSDLRWHYLGQISLEFGFIWYGLCCLFFLLCDLVRIMLYLRPKTEKRG